jgi:hypothetical protein
MEQVLRKLLDQSVKHLQALEGRGLIEFKVFTLDGEEFGKMKVTKPKAKKEKKKRPSPYPHGELTNHVTPFLSNVKPDQVVCIPVGKYDAERVRGTACSVATAAWGRATYSSTVSKGTNSVEIYRFPV